MSDDRHMAAGASRRPGRGPRLRGRTPGRWLALVLAASLFGVVLAVILPLQAVTGRNAHHMQDRHGLLSAAPNGMALGGIFVTRPPANT